MTLLFVYGRQVSGGTNYLEVGFNSEGKVIGFLPEADIIPWKHSLTLAFTNPANRERVLFLKDRPALVDMLNSDKLLVDAEKIRQQIAQGKLPPTSPVISIEPQTFVDMQKQFYLLPILDASTTMLKSGFKVRTVQIASVTKEKGVNALARPASASIPRPTSPSSPRASCSLSTRPKSMQPYIDLTRAAMGEVLRQVEDAKLNQRVRFGMVAYRDDPTKVKSTWSAPSPIRPRSQPTCSSPPR